MLREIKRSGAPMPIEDYNIPFGKAAKRHTGSDITVVAWGWAGVVGVSAAQRMVVGHRVLGEAS